MSLQRYLVTGAAGFIGSHLVEALLQDGNTVVGMDNLATGKLENIAPFRTAKGFAFVEGDLRDAPACRKAVEGVDVVLHQAALGSVPRSILHPEETHAVNVTGFVNMVLAARDAGVRRFVYASSSSVYGDSAELPKEEGRIGQALSPYAASKRMNEIYADVYGRCFGLEMVGLRYFNVFGPRQNPGGPYAAVIPAWIAAMEKGERVRIHGDGETSRDFCYIGNVVQANLKAARTDSPEALNQVYNVAFGKRTTLNQLFALLREGLMKRFPKLNPPEAVHGDFRAGDIRHSWAEIGKAQRLLGYQPASSLEQGLDETLNWRLKSV